MFKDTISLLCALSVALVLGTGCASYTVPGRAADLSVFTQDGVLDPVRETDVRPADELTLEELLRREPMAAFPTGVAMVRVQAPGYRSTSTRSTVGSGAYTVVSTREPGEIAALEPLGALPQVSGLAPINRLLVPARLQSDAELRKIAARLHADVLLLYTVDSSTETVWRKVILGVLTFGFAPTHETTVTSTASALLLDTRTGYVYGTAEATARVAPRHDVWESVETGEDAWREAEEKALASLAGEIERTWTGVVATYAPETQGTR